MPPPGETVAAASKQSDVGQANTARLKTAFALHRQGHLNQAEAIYTEILQSQPQHLDALQLLATIAMHRGKSSIAVELFDRALKIKPDIAEILNNRGIALRDMRHHEAALDSYDRALRIKPDYAEAMNNRGLVLMDLRRSAEALESFAGALRIKPDYAEALYNRGIALRDLKHPEAALESYERALQIKPNYAEALSNRGLVLADLQRYEAALESYEHALRIKPDFAEAIYNRGIAFWKLKRHDEALRNYDDALRIRPDHADAHNNRGNTLFDLGRIEEALESYERALMIKPDHAEALSNRGNALSCLGHFDEALESYERALRIKPDNAESLCNRGNAFLGLNQHEEALESYERALRIKPDYVEANWNESLCRLLLGDFDLGWRKYEWRWKSESLAQDLRNFSQPLWLGNEPLTGKAILLHAEQGYGDTLQFCRYTSLVSALGARVLLAVPETVKSLCRGLPGVSRLIAAGEPLPPFDFHTPLMSLPLALGTRLDSIPASVPYLSVDPEKVAAWDALLGPLDKPRIGLAWSGRPSHTNDRNRSLSFTQIADLIDDTAEFVCLHTEFRNGEESLVRQQSKVRIVSEHLKDFTDTAALIETLDLVITVDTSVAHLAGAIGKPVWILLPFAPDFRWLLDREDSPWYPSARLFRQRQPGQWTPVLAEVRAALTKNCASRGRSAGDTVSPDSETKY